LGRRLAVWLFSIGGLVVVCSDFAGAQGVSGDQYANSETEAPDVGIPSLQRQIDGQDAALQDKIEDISSVGRDLQEAQSRMDGARARSGELGDQTQELERKIAAQRESFRKSKADYEEQARAAYQGRNLEGLGALIDGWFGSGLGHADGLDAGVARVLADGRQDLRAYEESRDTLRELRRQISQKQNDYEGAVGSREAGDRLTLKIRISGRVEQIDLRVHPLGVCTGEADRETAFGLFAVEVREGGSVANGPVAFG